MKGVGASREVSGPERGERSASSKATSEKSGHEKAASSNAANGRTTKKKPRVRRRPTPGLFLSRKDRKNASSSPSDSSATPLRWVLGGALLLFVVAGLWMWRIATDEPPVVVVDETAAVEGETGEQRPELEDFKFAESPRLPDRVHPVDLMPGYLVGSGQLWMDAHEVTVGQFSKVASSSFALQGLVEQVDEPRFAGLPCATGLHDDASRTHEPVCASPQTAAVYCETVGRRLPLEEDWRAVLASDKPLIAVGYGRVFERASDGAPPAIAQPISGLLGVHGGLPELLEPNAAQRRFKDLVLWVGGEAEEVRVVRGADVAGTSSTMFGFRCVERVMIEDMMPAQGIADSELPPPASGQPAASRAQRSEGRTGSAPAGGRASGSVEPRVNPPNEAPIDPNVSDDSLILQRLRQHGAGKTP